MTTTDSTIRLSEAVASPTGGYRILTRASASYDGFFGSVPVSGISDLNGDGVPDIITAVPNLETSYTDIDIIFGKSVGGTTSSVYDVVNKITIKNLPDYYREAISVGSIHDLNGDGLNEILMNGPSTFQPNNMAFVLWGLPAAGEINLNNIHDQGYKIVAESGNRSRTSYMGKVTSIADMNGDGLDEILIGVPNKFESNTSHTGAAYVVWGKATTNTVYLDDVAAGRGGFKIIAEAAGDYAGTNITALGDLNGDGKAEILVSAKGNDATGITSGATYVIWGKDTTEAVNLSNIAAGHGGFRIIGGTVGSYTGTAITNLGDVNGDGIDDMLIGSKAIDKQFVVYGKSDTSEVNLLDVAAGNGGFMIKGGLNALRNCSITGGADFNRDGINDIVIGAPRDSEGGTRGIEMAGAVYIIWGGATSTVDVANLSVGLGGVKIIGDGRYSDETAERIGSNVAITDDMNGDGTPDLLIGTSAAVPEFPSLNVFYTPTAWQNINKDGDDNLFGNDKNNTLYAFKGNDNLYGGLGDDTLDGGQGIDTAVYSGLNVDYYYSVSRAGIATIVDKNLTNGNEGKDTLASIELFKFINGVVDYTHLTFDGTANDDINRAINNSGWTLHGLGGNDTINGREGADALYGDSGNDRVNGYGGNDILIGGDGNDRINGGMGNDRLEGGLGIDVLIGGEGSDIFVMDSYSLQAIDKISDFCVTQGDILEFYNLFEGYDEIGSAITDFIKITDSGGVRSNIYVDTDGAANGTAWTQIATLQGITGLTNEADLLANGHILINS